MKPQFKGIVRSRYAIATYIKPELLENINHFTFQELGKQAIEKTVKIREEDAIAVSEEKVKAYLENAVRKVIYVDRETHEKWVEFPKIFKNRLHYWVNVKLAELLKEAPPTPQIRTQKETSGTFTLAFYLFSEAAKLYEQGFINGKVLLSVLQELYDNQSEIEPLTTKTYENIKRKLGGAVKVFINFKHHPELRDWYVALPNELKRGVWVATHHKLLDKLSKMCYNIQYQNLKEV